jgi:hypothetical protein
VVVGRGFGVDILREVVTRQKITRFFQKQAILESFDSCNNWLKPS